MPIEKEKPYTNSYREDLKIDFSILQHNWADQARLFTDWGELHSEAIAIRDRKKEEIELKQSELDSAIRLQPEEFGLLKITEAAVTAAIKSDEGYRALMDELITLNQIVNDLSCYKTGFEHRKKALEGITQLYCAGYFAKPNIPTEAQEAFGGETKKEQQKALEEDSSRLKKKTLVKR